MYFDIHNAERRTGNAAYYPIQVNDSMWIKNALSVQGGMWVKSGWSLLNVGDNLTTLNSKIEYLESKAQILEFRIKTLEGK